LHVAKLPINIWVSSHNNGFNFVLQGQRCGYFYLKLKSKQTNDFYEI
jgi:hypothetical protein